MNKKLSMILAGLLAISMLSGCNSSNNNSSTKNNGKITKTTSDKYPIKTEAKLTYWLSLSGHVSAHSKSLNETPFAKGLIEKTGVNVEFIHPVIGQEKEQFNLMISSEDLPDIIEWSWLNNYSGGPQKAIDEGTIISLNDVLNQVSPNLKKFYEKNPDISNQMKTEKGQYYSYPFVMGAEKLMTYIGPMVRLDLLEKANLSMPETIKDWDKMLREFKKLGIDTPLTLKLDNKNLENVSAFLGAYGIAGTFYVEKDVVKFGPYEPAFKDYVAMMSNWYSEGLLDRNFMDTDSKRVTAIMANGQGGSAFGSAGGDFGKWIPAMQENNPSSVFVPVKYPVMNKGDRPMYGQKNLPATPDGPAITGSCEDIEAAARLLDYGYSDQGHMYYNFGTEGVSYNMINGVPTYSELITDKEKNGNLAIGPAMGKYIRACYNGPFVQDGNYLDQFYSMEVQREAAQTWSDTDTLDYKMPICPLTTEENNAFTKIMQDIDVYREETLFKTITGKISINEFDNYFTELKDRGIERAIEIKQNAYDRFKANK